MPSSLYIVRHGVCEFVEKILEKAKDDMDSDYQVQTGMPVYNIHAPLPDSCLIRLFC